MEFNDVTSASASAAAPPANKETEDDVIHIRRPDGSVVAMPMDEQQVLQKHATAFQARLKEVTPHIPVTLALVLLNVGVYALMAAFGHHGWAKLDIEEVAAWGANFGPLLHYGQWWRLFTSQFIHLDIAHLVFNMVFLYAAGRMAERMAGPVHFLLLYLVSGLTGSMIAALWNPTALGAGASGAIFGVYGFMLAFLLREKQWIAGDVLKSFSGNVTGFVAYNLWFGLFQAGVANSAHLGGLLSGIGIGYLLARPFDVEERVQDGDQHLLVPFVVSMVLIGLLFVPVTLRVSNIEPVAMFAAARNVTWQEDQELGKRINVLNQEREQRKITDAEFVNSIRIMVIPELERMRGTIGAPNLAEGTKEHELQSAILQFIDHRIQEARYQAEAIQEHKPELAVRAKEAHDHAMLDMVEIHHIMAPSSHVNPK
jgi:rhomboid protease GluP